MSSLERWLQNRVAADALQQVVRSMPQLEPAYAPAAPSRSPGRQIPGSPGASLPPSPPPPERRTGKRLWTAAATLFRALVVLGAWVLFVYWWWIVLRSEGIQALGSMLVWIGIGLAAIGLVAGWWIRHNLRIAHRGKRGRASRYLPVRFERDYLGRSLALPADDVLSTAPWIVIEIHEGAKRYRTANRPEVIR